MKFDFAIGNPPYQDTTSGDNDNFAPPVYNRFMDAAYSVADKVELIHPARFLFNAGSTPKAWNEKMLADPHFKVLEYEEDASSVFSNTDIKGGIVISYRDTSAVYGAIQVFTKYPEMNSIMKKAAPATDDDSLISIIYLQNRFDLDALYRDHPKLVQVIGSEGKDRRFRNNIFDKISLFTETKHSATDIPVYGVVRNVRQWRYFPRKYVDLAHENLSKWKVLIARVNGVGALDETLSSPVVVEPGSAFTQTFISVGAFETKEEAESALKYVKTKFARTLLHILKVTQDNNRDTWKYVPIQDFSSASDINWRTSVANIDRQLYKKYNLSQEEIDFIETHVKEME